MRVFQLMRLSILSLWDILLSEDFVTELIGFLLISFRWNRLINNVWSDYDSIPQIMRCCQNWINDPHVPSCFIENLIYINVFNGSRVSSLWLSISELLLSAICSWNFLVTHHNSLFINFLLAYLNYLWHFLFQPFYNS